MTRVIVLFLAISVAHGIYAELPGPIGAQVNSTSGSIAFSFVGHPSNPNVFWEAGFSDVPDTTPFRWEAGRYIYASSTGKNTVYLSPRPGYQGFLVPYDVVVSVVGGESYLHRVMLDSRDAETKSQAPSFTGDVKVVPMIDGWCAYKIEGVTNPGVGALVAETFDGVGWSPLRIMPNSLGPPVPPGSGLSGYGLCSDPPLVRVRDVNTTQNYGYATSGMRSTIVYSPLRAPLINARPSSKFPTRTRHSNGNNGIRG